MLGFPSQERVWHWGSCGERSRSCWRPLRRRGPWWAWGSWPRASSTPSPWWRPGDPPGGSWQWPRTDMRGCDGDTSDYYSPIQVIIIIIPIQVIIIIIPIQVIIIPLYKWLLLLFRYKWLLFPYSSDYIIIRRYKWLLFSSFEDWLIDSVFDSKNNNNDSLIHFDSLIQFLIYWLIQKPLIQFFALVV